MTIILRRVMTATALSGLGLLSACGGGGSDAGTLTYGTLGVYMTDAPACGFDNVYVTVDKVRAHKSEGAEEGAEGWVDIPVELDNPKVDLLTLTNGLLAKLGDVELPTGTYNQLRLVLKPNNGTDPLANSVVPSGSNETALVTPSAMQSGIKLNGSFTVEEGATTELALDFDACKSIVKRGNGSYGLKPVVTMVATTTGGEQTSGAISGVLDPAITGNPVVSAQVDGVVVKSTVPNANGEFSLSPLAAGSYTVVVTADGHASDVIDAVPVTAGSDTALATTATPLALEASATQSVSGKVAPAEAQALVSAQQSFASGAKVTIKYQNVDVVTGDYSMNLPVAAPRYAQFGALPVAPAADSAAAGKYVLEVTAQGYQTQSEPADLGTGAVAMDFALAP